MTFWNTPDKKQIEKKRIYKTANAVGGAFLIGFAIANILQVAFVRIVGDNTLISDPCVQWLLQIFISTIMFTLPFIIMTVPMNVRVSGVCSFKVREKGIALPIIFVGLGVCMLSNVLSSMVTSFFTNLGFEPYTSSLPTDTSGSLYIPILVILGGAVLPALIEEFALRGIVLGAFRKFGNGFAIIASAILFGLMHGNLEQIPFAFLMGLYLGFATVRTGSMLVAVVIHLINNGVAFLLDMLSHHLQSTGIYMLNSIYFLFSILVMALGLLLAKNKPHCFALENDEKSQLTLGEKLKTAAATPCMILMGLYVVFQILSYQILSWVTI